MTIFFDSETRTFHPGCMAPPITCISTPERLYHVSEAYPIVRGWLLGNELLVMHNGAYDLAVVCAEWPDLIPLVFDKLDRDEVTDTMVRQVLLDVANGCYRLHQDQWGRWRRHKYGLSDLHNRFFGVYLDKDTYRLKYGELRALPLNEWPEGARLYPIEDAVATKRVYRVQPERVPDEFRQTRYAFAQQLTRCWGFRTSDERIARLLKDTKDTRNKVFMELIDARLVRPSGKKNVATIAGRVSDAYLGNPPLTDKGNVSISAETCRDSDDPVLNKFADWSELGTILNKEIPALRAGATYPIHGSYAMADTGRARSFKPALHNITNYPGVKSCIVPRPGYVFAIADFESLELRCFAQVCLNLFGYSNMAREINAGKDLHMVVASTILRKPYEWCVANADLPEVQYARQSGKIGNFGLVANASPETLCAFAKATYGVIITLEQATLIKHNWLKSWPEALRYFNYISSLQCSDGSFDVTTQLSGRRGTKLRYTQAANRLMQALGADASMLAWYLLQRAAYSKPDSPFFGSRVLLNTHDEFAAEVPEATAHLAAREMEHIMCVAANRVHPDVPARAPVVLTRSYGKFKKPRLSLEGLLIPYDAQ